MKYTKYFKKIIMNKKKKISNVLDQTKITIYSNGPSVFFFFFLTGKLVVELTYFPTSRRT